jgi:hypothetical protein
MARITGGRQADELARSRILVAIFALHENMCSNEWKAILVVLNRLQRNLPSLDRVAVGAIGPELTAMNVGVTVRTLRTYVLENQAGMALDTAHILMHTAERVSGLIVIEFGIRPDRFPTGVRMTIAHGMESGPWGFVTLAWGMLTPAFTPETPLELPEDLPLELLEDRPPGLLLELASSVTAKPLPKITAFPVGDSATPSSTGDNPSAMVARQRAKSIVLSGQRFAHVDPRGAQTGKQRNPGKPASHARRQL